VTSRYTFSSNAVTPREERYEACRGKLPGTYSYLNRQSTRDQAEWTRDVIAGEQGRDEYHSSATNSELDAAAIAAIVDQLAASLGQRLAGEPDPCLIGVQRRGDLLAQRIRERLPSGDLQLGSLDITLYRDDFDSLTEAPVVGQTDIPFPLEGRTVILVDDVLFTGRTIRAALEEIHELGRPRRVLLVVLVDRGWRELPIAADLVGVRIDTVLADNVQVHLSELDGEDAVRIQRAK
jgi:pyrimidine operon attenuation protein / uracil phosphoribosyltransferase